MNRRILITGAGTGIGAATALRLAEPQTVIGIHYHRSKSSAQSIAMEVQAKGAKAILIQGDLGQPEPCERLVEDFIGEAGGMDVLINNAGALIRRGALETIDWPLLEEIFRLNVFSTLYISKLSLPHLKEGVNPCIVNVGSIAGRHGAPTATAYGAAKSAIHAFTRGLAKEVAPAIRVNCVAPGIIETPFHEKVSTAEQMKNWSEMAPLKRNGKPEEIAEAIAFLCSPGAAFITGETIDVNGGMFMR
ncbi:MAG: SDR family NAD(P)-dependent oxidoreductase [Candidatus Sumerlaeota bacterium]|nr:SDR family NAD(P)-dependent oxidoreductase [Candidatus Sumerlaeota bacterium]